MVMNRVRFTENGLEAWNPDKEQWEPLTLKATRRGNVIVTQNNKVMGPKKPRPEDMNQLSTKYKVKTGLLDGIERGDKIFQMNNGDFRQLRSEGNKHVPKEVVERNPDWFEPVEQVQEATYWTDGQVVLRASDISEGMVRLQDIRDDKPNSARDRISYLQDVYRKLSTDEIEQALKEEAKRRGYRSGVDVVPTNKKSKRYTLSGKKNWNNEKYKYDCDILWMNVNNSFNARIYDNGDWAQIDQTPHIEINGKQIDIEDGTVKISCGDTIEEEIFKNFYAVVNKYNLDVSRNGEDINDQLRQIWDEMPSWHSGETVEWTISVDSNW